MPRKLGSLNKKTIEKQRVQQMVDARIAKANAPERKLGKEILEDLMYTFIARATYWRKEFDTAITATNLARADYCEEQMSKHLGMATTSANMLAKFQSPTLRAIAIAPAPAEKPKEERTRFTLRVFESGASEPVQIVTREIEAG
jgi:hypothetical protein